MGVLDWITSSALSLTVAGNSGISPFLTLLLLGCIEKSDPTLLHMEGWIETLLASWWSIGIFAVMALLEFIGKCVPVVDEIIDSVEVFLVPVLSIFSSLGTLGVLDMAAEAAASTLAADGNAEAATTNGERRLGSVSNTFVILIKVVLVIAGILLALAIHLFKMLMRLIGLTCCVGICQPCITVVEVCIVCSGVLLAVFIRQIAIGTCVALLMAAVYAIYKKFIQKDKNSDDENQEIQQNGQGQTSSASAPTPASAPASTSSSQTKASASSPVSPGTTTALQNDEENPPAHHTVPIVEADVQAYVAYGCLVAAALAADFWGQYFDRCWTFLAAPEISDSRRQTSNETTLKPALPLYPDYVETITVQTNADDNNQ